MVVDIGAACSLAAFACELVVVFAVTNSSKLASLSRARSVASCAQQLLRPEGDL